MQANAADEVTEKAMGSVLMCGISCARDNSDVVPCARLVKTGTTAGSEISSAAGRVDTGFASARVKIRDASPRSGLPPTFRSWEEFEEYTGALVAMGNIPDFSWFWWDVRPHPRLGTVELRVPDVQAEPDYVAPLAALTQCLVATAEDTAPADARYISENKWRAIRRGLDARFYDFATKREIEAREMARDLVTRLHPVSQGLGCEAELAGILEIVHRGTSAALQRAVYENRGSFQDVVDYRLETTAAPG